jgi:hypothetical protein
MQSNGESQRSRLPAGSWLRNFPAAIPILQQPARTGPSSDHPLRALQACVHTKTRGQTDGGETVLR